MKLKHQRLHPENEKQGRWTRWVQPVMHGYLLSCCDCSLVHRLNFRIYKGRIQFKAQRAPVYTRRERERAFKRRLKEVRLSGDSER